MISSATAPPFLGSWASVFVIWLTLMFGLSCVVHLASLVLFPALLVVPGALAWSLYVGWLRAHTPPDFDNLFFKMATYGFWFVSLLVMFVSLVLSIPFVLSWAIDDASTETAQALPPPHFAAATASASALPYYDEEEGYKDEDGGTESPGDVFAGRRRLGAIVGGSIKMGAMETMLVALISALFVACIEEVAKVRYLQTPLHLSPAEAGRRAHATLAQTIAIALGFALSSSVFGLLVSYAKSGGYQSVAAGGAALAIVIDFLTVAPLHALCAAVTGLRTVVRSLQRAHQVALLVRASVSASAMGVSLQQQEESISPAPTTAIPSQPPQQPPPQPQPLQQQPQQQSQPLPQQQQSSSIDSSEPSDLPLSLPTVNERLVASRLVASPASVTAWSWSQVLWPAIVMNSSYAFLSFLVFDDSVPTMGQTALCLVLHTALLLGCYVAVNHMFLQQWLLLVAGEEPVPISPLASFLQLVRSAPRDVLLPFWWRPEFAAAAAGDSEATVAGSC